MSRPEGHGRGESLCYEPEVIFELAEGSLGPEREQEVREHLSRCPVCRELYERELDLSSFLEALKSPDGGHPSGCEVSRRVAMALPTRSMRARLLWAALAGALAAAVFVLLSLHGGRPFGLLAELTGTGWGLVSGLEEVVRVVLDVSGPAILALLLIGAALDLLIAAAVLLVRRGRRPRRA
ncbi:MAG: zf-HC2 domain-containing protein [Rubrobacter sp.]|nr:zf-HC2 domain-containing protein [Rubrobacter sp.]